ncbi:MAG TPA: hypothetical protein PK916_15965 [Bacteroidota bacterium]|nr:hypothetical protein [Bacteroidota bacterium]
MRGLQKSTLLMLAAALIAACSFTTANIKKAVMAREINEDKSPAMEVTSFHGYESMLHCCVEMANVPSGTKVKAIWRSNEGAVVIDSTEIELESDSWIDFSLTLSEQALPYGAYTVDLFINGKKDRSVPFTVVPKFEEGIIKEAVTSKAISESYFPQQPTAVFPTNTAVVYAPIYVQDAPQGSKFSAYWYQHDTSGGRAPITSADIEFADSGWIGFSMTLNNGLPAGKYSVDILLNGAVEQTLEFSAK